MNKKALIDALSEMEVLLELDGANPFRSGAYGKAVRALEGSAEDLEERIAQGTLTGIDGIGKGLAEKIEEFARDGKIEELEELRARFPEGLIEMTRIPGLGPKKARSVYTELGIETVKELEEACNDGRLAGLKGFGEKTAKKILDGIAQLARFSGRHRLDVALAAAAPVLEKLRALKQVQEVETAGSLRRRKETAGDLDFVAATGKPKEVMEAFVSLDDVTAVLGKGETKSSVMLGGKLQADLRCVSAAEYPYALLHFTGSKEHNTRLRQIAREKKMKLNEYGLFPDGKKKPLAAKAEEDVYRHLGLSYIPPELREDIGEVEAAAEGKLPKLLEPGDIRGIPHMHTVYSDGKPYPEDYAEWASENGIEWMGITDHSRSLAVVQGLTIEKVRAQHGEIDALNKEWSKKGVRLLKGIESDILKDGSLDYPDDILDEFDFIICSVHTYFNLTEKEQTARVMKALDHPAATILGHMTGRLILARDGIAIDQRAVIRHAAKVGAAIELNANPRRLDMDWRLLPYAVEQGVRIAIGPDAHRMEGLKDMSFGVAMARKGWLEKKHVLNCLSADEFLKFARSKKK